MSSALVLAERGAGLTTFVGLLYTAQVRLGTELTDEFRFSADHESIRRIAAIYGELGDGRFPEHDADWEEHPLSFVFGFRRGRFARMARSSASEDGEFDTVRVQVGGIPADEVAELNSHDAVLSAGTRRLLRSPVVIPLVDAGWLSDDPAGIGGLPMLRYDHTLAGTLTLLGKWLAAARRPKDRRMYPIFIVTKFDRATPETLKSLHAPAGDPESWPADERQALGGRILQRYFPETAKVLAAKWDGAPTIRPPVWFFSSVRTEERDGETRILRRSRSPLGGWEPEYPFVEYRTLIERIAELSHKLPTEAEA